MCSWNGDAECKLLVIFPSNYRVADSTARLCFIDSSWKKLSIEIWLNARDEIWEFILLWWTERLKKFDKLVTDLFASFNELVFCNNAIFVGIHKLRKECNIENIIRLLFYHHNHRYNHHYHHYQFWVSLSCFTNSVNAANIIIRFYHFYRK